MIFLNEKEHLIHLTLTLTRKGRIHLTRKDTYKSFNFFPIKTHLAIEDNYGCPALKYSPRYNIS